MVRVIALVVGLAGVAVFLWGLGDIIGVATCDEHLSRSGKQIGADCQNGTAGMIVRMVVGAFAAAGALVAEGRTRRVQRLGLVPLVIWLAWGLGAAVVLLFGSNAEGLEHVIGILVGLGTLLVVWLAARHGRRKAALRERGTPVAGVVRSASGLQGQDLSGAQDFQLVVEVTPPGEAPRQVKATLAIPCGDPWPQAGEPVVVFFLDGRHLVARDAEAFARAGLAPPEGVG